MDDITFETYYEAIAYVKERGQELLLVNQFLGFACPKCKEYDSITLYADEPEE